MNWLIDTKVKHKNNVGFSFEFDCNSQCVIYLITCKVCRNQYVGSTITLFRKWFIPISNYRQKVHREWYKRNWYHIFYRKSSWNTQRYCFWWENAKHLKIGIHTKHHMWIDRIKFFIFYTILLLTSVFLT